MKAHKITHPEITLDLIRKEKKKAKGMQEVLRCLALEFVLEGKQHKEITQMLKLGQNTVSQCISRVNKHGLLGLHVAKGRGRKPSLTEKQKEELKEAILKSPRSFGYQQSNWTGKLIRKRIKKHYGIDYKRSSIYPLLKSLGLTIQRPNRLYGEADKKAQEAFKKN